MTALEDSIIRHEGIRLDVYEDTADPPRLTIGIGRNLSDVGLRSEAEARYLLANDIAATKRQLLKRWGHLV